MPNSLASLELIAAQVIAVSSISSKAYSSAKLGRGAEIEVDSPGRSAPFADTARVVFKEFDVPLAPDLRGCYRSC
jgi:hypothetical protein